VLSQSDRKKFIKILKTFFLSFFRFLSSPDTEFHLGPAVSFGIRTAFSGDFSGAVALPA
jgi:hypothetical protein